MLPPLWHNYLTLEGSKKEYWKNQVRKKDQKSTILEKWRMKYDFSLKGLSKNYLHFGIGLGKKQHRRLIITRTCAFNFSEASRQWCTIFLCLEIDIIISLSLSDIFPWRVVRNLTCRTKRRNQLRNSLLFSLVTKIFVTSFPNRYAKQIDSDVTLSFLKLRQWFFWIISQKTNLINSFRFGTMRIS